MTDATLPPALDPTQTPIYEQTFAELVTSMNALVGAWNTIIGLYVAWANGVANGGPNGDGKYPLALDDTGETTGLFACPATYNSPTATFNLMKTAGLFAGFSGQEAG